MKFTKQDWIKKGSDFLNNEGAHALMIDYLCARLRITKGSFYHYFDSVDEYILLVIKSWEQQSLESMEKIAASQKMGEEKLDQMRDFAFRFSGKLETGIRSLSLKSKKIKSIIDRVELKQLDLLTVIFTEFGAPKQRARELAEITHSGWIGILISSLNSRMNRDHAVQELRDMVMSHI